ncbi:MAG: GH25 family lysozyme [Bacteroidales bacterium]|nr:GH25 family lysozyme [Bacteroidales bacterium]
MTSTTASRKTKKQKSTTIAKSKRTRPKKKHARELALWQLVILRIVVVVLLVSGIYYFLIHPNSYRWKPCTGVKAYGVCLPKNYDVHGFDISHFQGDIQWGELTAQSPSDVAMRFVLVKATEGGDYVDDMFAQYFSEARSHGLIRGAYHYFIATTDPVEQARNFIQTVQLKKGDLPPIVDVEQKGLNAMQLQNDLKLWLRLVEQHYGVPPIIYSSHKFRKKYLQHDSFNRYPFWLARYYVSEPDRSDWVFWQHTDSGTLPGIGNQVDLNVFHGTIEQLRSLTLK